MKKKTVTWFYTRYADDRYDSMYLIKRLNHKGILEFKKFFKEDLISMKFLDVDGYGLTLHNDKTRNDFYDYFKGNGETVEEKDVSTLFVWNKENSENIKWLSFNVDVRELI